jgi:hypothetical protein
MNKRTGITALVVILTLFAVGVLWAEDADWPSWTGKDNADKKEWDEMGACYTEFMNAYRLINSSDSRQAAKKLYEWGIESQKESVKYWKKNKAMHQKYLAEIQALVAEQQRVRNAPVTEADFAVEITKDAKGIVITRYKGKSAAVTIPASFEGMPVLEIGHNAFRELSHVTSVIIPNGVTVIGPVAFFTCKQLAHVTLPSTLRTIGAAAFASNGLKSIVIPSATEIGDNAFSNCTSLTSVTMPNNVTKIGDNAFSGCKSLASVTIAEGVTQIGEQAFSSCTSLTTFTIPDSVKTIAKEAFENCKSLTTVTISPIKRTWIGSRSFYQCPKISLSSQAALRAAGYTGEF